MELFVLLIFILYSALVIFLIAGWQKAVNLGRKGFGKIPESSVSVVVAVRNEEPNMSTLIQSLLAQEYSNFKIVIVDDHSTDQTSNLLQQVGRIKVIANPGHGKKSALTAGIHHADGDIIATTDADCILPTTWLKSINAALADPGTKFSFGGVRIERDESFFSNMQALEFASLIGSGGAMAAFGSPIMCNGANLAYRKSVFSEVKGFEGNFDIASGDDEFLMRKIHQKYPGGVVFDSSTDRIVTTAPASDIRTFIQQRIRWAAKWKHNTSFTSIAVALFVTLVQVSTIGMWAFAVFDRDVVFLSALLVKLMLEGFFLFRVCKFLDVRWSTASFLVLQVAYPLYVLGVGIMSNFVSFQWKGRTKGLVLPLKEL